MIITIKDKDREVIIDTADTAIAENDGVSIESMPAHDDFEDKMEWLARLMVKLREACDNRNGCSDCPFNYSTQESHLCDSNGDYWENWWCLLTNSNVAPDTDYFYSDEFYTIIKSIWEDEGVR